MIDYMVENPVFADKISIVEEDDLVNAENDTAAVKQLLQNDLVLAARIDKVLGDDNESGPEFADGLDAKNVVDAVNKVFLSGSEKKTQLVANLTAMGIQASANDTWDVLLDKILDMTDTSGDTVTAPVLLTGYTAHDATGESITGEMPELADVTVEAISTTQDDNYTYLGLPAGHYSEDSKVRTKNSNLKYSTTKIASSSLTTSFNIKNILPDKYSKLTKDDFFIASVDGNTSGWGHSSENTGISTVVYYTRPTITSYTPSSGILVVTHGVLSGYTVHQHNETFNFNTTLPSDVFCCG